MRSLDHIHLIEIECQARIGVSEGERSHRQELRIDVDLGLDLEPAGNSDRLDLTLDYGEVARLIRSEVARSNFKLLEALAYQLVQTLLALPRVQEVTLKVYKYPADLVGQVKQVAVSVNRRNSGL